MSDLSDLPIYLVSPYERTAVVAPYGFPMTCTFEHDEGEAPIIGNNEFAHPGFPATVSLLSCKVGEVDITEMLSSSQIDRIEDAILQELES